MNRRAVLHAVAVSTTGIAGCFGGDSDGAGSTTVESTATTEAATRAATENAETTNTDDCPPSAVPATRRRVRSDYGLRFVRNSGDRPAVAIVAEEWRSVLRTDAMTDADERFLADTDFDQFVVLVVQYEKGSGGHDLRVTDLNVDDSTVHADVCVVADGATNDAPTANLLVRVPHDESPPERARVKIRTPTGDVNVSSE